MRAGLLTFAVLVASAAAAPRNLRHYHLHAHEKRAEDVAVAADVVYVTATAAQAVVYVDGNGNPVSTAYNAPSASQPTQKANEPAEPQPDAPSYQQPETSSTSQAAAKLPPAYTPPADTTPANTPAGYAPPQTPSPSGEEAPSSTEAAPAASSTSDQSASPGGYGGSILTGRGITYTPYNSDGTVKTQDQVTSDLASIDGYSTVRIYDTNNHQIAMLIQAAKPKGMRVFVGFTDPTTVETDTQNIIDDAKNDWDSIHTVAVGNEATQKGISDDVIISAVGTARSMLRAAGYSGPVVTVGSNAVLGKGAVGLWQNSDYIAANIHPWYNDNTPASSAGGFVSDQARLIASAAGSDPSNVLVTETGWPWQGTTHGTANRMVASPSDQDTAISSLQSSFGNNVIFFSAFDELWKDPGQYDCERYFGILRHNTS